jgi:hypothetical protein
MGSLRNFTGLVPIQRGIGTSWLGEWNEYHEFMDICNSSQAISGSILW